MSSELFKAMSGTFIVHIPFRGSGPAQAAMLGNETQMMIDNLPPQLAHIKSGKVRALAVTEPHPLVGAARRADDGRGGAEGLRGDRLVRARARRRRRRAR